MSCTFVAQPSRWQTPHQPRLCQLVCSHLIYLILLASVNRLRIRGRPQPELRITEISVSVHVVQTFPHHFLLRQEALIRDQEVQLTLRWTHTHTHTYLNTLLDCLNTHCCTCTQVVCVSGVPADRRLEERLVLCSLVSGVMGDTHSFADTGREAK